MFRGTAFVFNNSWCGLEAAFAFAGPTKFIPCTKDSI